MNATPYRSRSSAPAPGDTLLKRMWQASPPLCAVGLLLIAVAGASLWGMFVDPRVIAGAPAWLKPFKFAASTAAYALTFAWVFTHLSGRPRVRRVVGLITAVVSVLEVAIIGLQAWRGTISHFNGATALDLSLYIVMGAAIGLQTLASVAVAVALFRQRFADRPLGWALRLGMVITLLGALTGSLMSRPTPTQLEGLRAGERVAVVGAHSVGGADGGPGLPLTRWSREHGDLRVPHFVGLHAIQALAIAGLGVRRWRRPEAARVRAVLVAGASYAGLFFLLLWQALRGQSLAAPDATALAAFALWAASTALAFGAVGVGLRRAPSGGPRELAA